MGDGDFEFRDNAFYVVRSNGPQLSTECVTHTHSTTIMPSYSLYMLRCRSHVSQLSKPKMKEQKRGSSSLLSFPLSHFRTKRYMIEAFVSAHSHYNVLENSSLACYKYSYVIKSIWRLLLRMYLIKRIVIISLINVQNLDCMYLNAIHFAVLCNSFKSWLIAGTKPLKQHFYQFIALQWLIFSYACTWRLCK